MWRGPTGIIPRRISTGWAPFSARGDRTSFRYRAPEVQGRAVVRPADTIEAGVRLGRMNVSVGPGTDTRFPSIEQRFTAAAAPGLDAQPDYTYTDIFAVLDSRDQPGNARAGAYVGATWRRYNDLDLDRFSFDQVNVEAQHFLPIFDKKRVIASRFLVMTTTAGDEHEVPFYMRPTVGGSDTLRSASDFRFRDRNAAVLNVEYRWEAFSGLDMALFTDLATVAPRFSDLEFARREGGLRYRPALQHVQGGLSPARRGRRRPRRDPHLFEVLEGLLTPMRLRLAAGLVALLTGAAVLTGNGQKFYPDDPIWRDPETQDASTAAPVDISQQYDFVENTFLDPGDQTPTRALNVNTVDEVPDSSWFTNRIAARRDRRANGWSAAPTPATARDRARGR